MNAVSSVLFLAFISSLVGVLFFRSRRSALDVLVDLEPEEVREEAQDSLEGSSKVAARRKRELELREAGIFTLEERKIVSRNRGSVCSFRGTRDWKGNSPQPFRSLGFWRFSWIPLFSPFTCKEKVFVSPKDRFFSPDSDGAPCHGCSSRARCLCNP